MGQPERTDAHEIRKRRVEAGGGMATLGQSPSGLLAEGAALRCGDPADIVQVRGRPEWAVPSACVRLKATWVPFHSLRTRPEMDSPDIELLEISPRPR